MICRYPGLHSLPHFVALGANDPKWTWHARAFAPSSRNHHPLLRVFRIEQLWGRVINEINGLFGARKGLVRLVEHGPNVAK
jgi:hypothetical protein